MRVIGIGAQDDLAYAKRFPDITGTTFTMLWDESFKSWRHYGIVYNSDVWLLDRNGNRLGQKHNGLNVDYIEQLLATLT